MCEKNNMVIHVSAPGKVILFGEHSVVYNKLAIASSLDLRTKVTLQENDNSVLIINFEDLHLREEYNMQVINSLFEKNSIPLISEDLKYNWTKPSQINHEKYLDFIVKSFQLDGENYAKDECLSLTAFFYLYFGMLMANNVPVKGLSVTIKTDLSLGSGTGSSASLLVSISGAFLRYLTAKMPDCRLSTEHVKVTDNFTETELDVISNWAYAAEKIIHGNPSGIDNTICTFGSMVSFRKGMPPNNIKTSQSLHGLLIDTQVPKNTGVMVKKVAELKERHPKTINSIFESMEEIANEAVEHFLRLGTFDNAESCTEIEDCYRNLNELSDINQNLLRSLGVSHPALDKVISILSKSNIHGKITGAGGGGYAIALVPHNFVYNDIQMLCSELLSKGYKPLLTKLGGSGVTVDCV